MVDFSKKWLIFLNGYCFIQKSVIPLPYKIETQVVNINFYTMKTTKTFQTIEQTCYFIETMCNAYSVVIENPFIESDGKISVRHLQRIDKECAEYGCDYTFWIGIRTRGVESSENKAHVIKRVMDLNDKTMCAIKVEYINGEYAVSYNKRSIEF